MLFTSAVAGLRVLTNRRVAPACDALSTDGTMTILFGDAEKIALQMESRRSDEGSLVRWYCLPEWSNVPAYLCQNGTMAFIVEPSFAPVDHGEQVRRILPFASALQGRMILHASAVQAGSAVIAFIGASGVGKSTLATQLSALGFRAITDDLLPCRTYEQRVGVFWTEQEAAPVFLPLTALYFLSRKKQLNQPCWTPMTRKVCVQHLLQNGFGELPVAHVWAAQFTFYARLAQQVPAFLLEIPDDLTKVGNTALRVMTRESV